MDLELRRGDGERGVVSERETGRRLFEVIAIGETLGMRGVISVYVGGRKVGRMNFGSSIKARLFLRNGIFRDGVMEVTICS